MSGAMVDDRVSDTQMVRSEDGSGPSLDYVQHNCNSRFGSWGYANRETGEWIPFRCKSWRCLACGPRKARRLRNQIGVWAEEKQLTRLMTLTLDPQQVQGDVYAHLSDVWRKFRVYLARQYGRVSFIWVMELQKNGNPHLHVLVDRFIHQKWASRTWDAVGGGRIVDGTGGPPRDADLRVRRGKIAEIGVGNLFVNFVSRPDIGNMTTEAAGRYLTLLWGGMMVGRFVGSAIMQKVPAGTVLAVFSIGAFIVMLATVFTTGPVAMWSLILGIRGLGPLTEEGSGLLIMAIAGGALVAVHGWLADHYGLQQSFLLTAVCELYILFYAVWGSKPTNAFPDEDAN